MDDCNNRQDPKRRYAYEWFVKDQDRFFRELTRKDIEQNYKRIKKVTALAVTSTVIGITSLVLAICSTRLHKNL